MPVTLSVTAAVAKDVLEGTRLLNSANLTTSMPGVGGVVSNAVEVPVGEPVLSVTKSASAKSVAPGDEFTTPSPTRTRERRSVRRCNRRSPSDYVFRQPRGAGHLMLPSLALWFGITSRLLALVLPTPLK